MNIKGVEIDEIEDLDYNLVKVRKGIRENLSFWSFYNAAVSSYEKENKIAKTDRVFKAILFIGLFPKFIRMLFTNQNIEKVIEEAELDLIKHYDQPMFKVRRFRLKCQYEKSVYEKEIEIIETELVVHRKNLELNSIGIKTRNEIKELIEAFTEKKNKRQNKYNFYQECENKLISIEEHLHVRQSIENSRMKLEGLREGKIEKTRHEEIEKEFGLYEYYGNLLDNISMNMKRLELDQEEEIEELELIDIIAKIKVKA